MAQQKVKAVGIDTSDSRKSLSDLRKEIQQTKDEIFKLQQSGQDYDDQLKQLNQSQQELSNFMATTQNGCKILEGSYTALSLQMSQLKKEYKSVASDAERSQIAEKIVEINNQLKDMDAQVGVYSRNVGNYVGAMNETFGQLGITTGSLGPIFTKFANSAAEAGAKGQSAMTGMAAGAKSLGSAFKSLIANPVGAVIMAIVVAIKALKAGFDAVKKSIEGNEVATNNMKKALAPIKGIVNAVKAVFDNFVETLTKVAAKIGEVIGAILEFLGFGNEAVQLEEDIAKRQEEVDQLKRKNIVTNAKLEQDAAEAREKAADKEMYTAQQRLKFAEEAGKKQEDIAKNNLKLAEKELELLKKEAAEGKNNKEMNDKLAEAQARVYRVQTEYANALRATHKEVQKIKNEVDAEAEAARRAANEAYRRRKEERERQREEYEGIVENLKVSKLANEYEKQKYEIQKYQTETMKKLNEEYNNGKKGSAINKEQYDAAVKELNAEVEKRLLAVAMAKADYLEQLNNNFKKLYNDDYRNAVEAEEKKWNDEIKIIQDAMDKQLIDVNSGEEKLKTLRQSKQKAIQDVEKKYWIGYYQDIYDKRLDDEKALYDNESKLMTVTYLEGKLKTKEYEEDIYNQKKEYNEKQIDILKEEYETLEKYLPESYELRKEIHLKVLELLEEQATLEKEHIDQINNAYIQAVAEAIDATNECFNAIVNAGDGIATEWAKVGSNITKVMESVTAAIKKGEKGFKEWAQIGAQSCNVVGSMFGALAAEQDTNDRKQFETEKKLRIGEVVFSSLSGIMAAWASSMQLGPIAGPIAAGVLSTLIGGLAYSQIKAITNRQFDDGGASDVSSSAAKASSGGISMSLQAPVQYTSDVQGARNEEDAQDTRVYVLESDISNTQRRVRTAQSEASY